MDDADSDDAAGQPDANTTAADDGDRFVVGVQITDDQLRFVVHVPSEIDSGWRDPEAFQQLVADVTWEHLDQETTLQTIAATGEPGETVTLGHVTLQPDGTVVDAELTAPAAENSLDHR